MKPLHLWRRILMTKKRKMLKKLVLMKREVNTQSFGMSLASPSNLESLKMQLIETSWQDFPDLRARILMVVSTLPKPAKNNWRNLHSLRGLKRKNFEVIFFIDPVDEYT